MPHPQRPKNFHEKDLVDQRIDEFTGLEEVTEGDLNKVAVAEQIQEKLDEYRAKALGMTAAEFRSEVHQSARLGEFLGNRPHEKCHAHAIVSGGHPRAARPRAILARLKMRIDDPHNGCWLPENTSAKREMPRWLKDAIPHSRIHRNGYYFWLRNVISLAMIKDLQMLKAALKDVETKLQASTLPPYVMLTAAQLRSQGIEA